MTDAKPYTLAEILPVSWPRIRATVEAHSRAEAELKRLREYMVNTGIADLEARLSLADGRRERAEAALAAVTAELDLERQKERARLSAILYTVGGEVDGAPTLAINYLQRLRKLVLCEAALVAALPTLEDEVERTRQSVADWPTDTNGPPTLANDEKVLANARAALSMETP